MSIGGASVAVVEHRHNAMHCEAFKGRLEAVLQMIDRGDLGGGMGYGCDEHKAALHIVERQIAATRARIAEMEAEDDAAVAIPRPTPSGCLRPCGHPDCVDSCRRA